MVSTLLSTVCFLNMNEDLVRDNLKTDCQSLLMHKILNHTVIDVKCMQGY